DNARCSDNRIHGILQFYGANRTGRWAGRLLQVQNLPRNYLSEIDFARQLVKEKDVEGIELMYEDVPDTLKQLIRTGLVAKEGHRFIVSDFSAIEA
ncbi:DNA polymerase, partial [Enterococcus faecalis]